MTGPESMARKLTRKELLELAGLDALGLLDEYEAAAYTRSFEDVPATVQDEIKRLQADVANDESLLPNDEPAPELRQRVLDFISEAMDREAAPLATIGPRRRLAGADRNLKLGLSTSGQFWRAASFVLAAAGLALAYLFTDAYQSSNELTKAALYDDAVKLEVLLAPSAKDFLLDDSRKIVMDAVTRTDDYRAALFVNENSGQVLLVMDSLPATDGDDYVLQVVLEDGSLSQLQAFRSMGRFGGVRLDKVSAQVLASAAIWQIADLATGAVLLSSA